MAASRSCVLLIGDFTNQVYICFVFLGITNRTSCCLHHCSWTERARHYRCFSCVLCFMFCIVIKAWRKRWEYAGWCRLAAHCAGLACVCRRYFRCDLSSFPWPCKAEPWMLLPLSDISCSRANPRVRAPVRQNIGGTNSLDMLPSTLLNMREKKIAEVIPLKQNSHISPQAIGLYMCVRVGASKKKGGNEFVGCRCQ